MTMKIQAMLDWSPEEKAAKAKEWAQSLFTLRLQKATGHLTNIVEACRALLWHPVRGVKTNLRGDVANPARYGRYEHAAQGRNRLRPSQDQHRPPSLVRKVAPTDVAPRHHGSSRISSRASRSAAAISSSDSGKRS